MEEVIKKPSAIDIWNNSKKVLYRKDGDDIWIREGTVPSEDLEPLELGRLYGDYLVTDQVEKRINTTLYIVNLRTGASYPRTVETRLLNKY